MIVFCLQGVLLPSEACENLKNQSFVKPDRIKSKIVICMYICPSIKDVFFVHRNSHVE